jgi:uncharacterized lipoprotein YajG
MGLLLLLLLLLLAACQEKKTIQTPCPHVLARSDAKKGRGG